MGLCSNTIKMKTKTILGLLTALLVMGILINIYPYTMAIIIGISAIVSVLGFLLFNLILGPDVTDDYNRHLEDHKKHLAHRKDARERTQKLITDKLNEK